MGNNVTIVPIDIFNRIYLNSKSVYKGFTREIQIGHSLPLKQNNISSIKNLVQKFLEFQSDHFQWYDNFQHVMW